jgi:hypothetical protein
MTTEELHEHLRQIRHSRRTPKASTKKRQTKKVKEKAKEAKKIDLNTMPKELLADLLADLEDEE